MSRDDEEGCIIMRANLIRIVPSDNCILVRTGQILMEIFVEWEQAIGAQW